MGNLIYRKQNMAKTLQRILIFRYVGSSPAYYRLRCRVIRYILIEKIRMPLLPLASTLPWRARDLSSLGACGTSRKIKLG